MNLKIQPVSLEDFHKMQVDWTGHLDHGLPNYWDLVMQVAATAGLYVDGQLVIILGMISDGTGVCSVFVISSTHVKARWVQRLILRHASTGLKLLQGIYKPHRLQAIVNPENPAHVAFIKHFGFEYEGTMRYYTPSGQSADMYGRRAFE